MKRKSRFVFLAMILGLFFLSAFLVTTSYAEDFAGAEITYFDCDGFCNMSVCKNYGACYLQAGESIPVRPLDFLKLDRCDLIKLDLEGHELFALKGAIQTIQQFKPTLVLEVCPGNMAKFDYQPEDLYKYLDEINYKVIYKRGKEVLLDVVCVPK